nr:MAG TPA: hypothetical protein [Caudoviricetes sp.]
MLFRSFLVRPPFLNSFNLYFPYIIHYEAYRPNSLYPLLSR